MKKHSLLSFLLLMFFGITTSFAQHMPTYPIPSYNVIVNPAANFTQSLQPAKNDFGKEKRGITVKLREENQPCNCVAEIWFYTIDRTTILGPYTVHCGESVRVEIDDREWGVLVESADEVLVDVWYN